MGDKVLGRTRRNVIFDMVLLDIILKYKGDNGNSYVSIPRYRQLHCFQVDDAVLPRTVDYDITKNALPIA